MIIPRDTYHICTRVYFTLRFKRDTGFSPRDWRKHALERETAGDDADS